MGEPMVRFSHDSWAAEVGRGQRIFHISWVSQRWLGMGIYSEYWTYVGQMSAQRCARVSVSAPVRCGWTYYVGITYMNTCEVVRLQQ